MPPLTPLAIVQLLSPSNPNPPSREQLDRLTAQLSLSNLQTVVQLIGLGDLARVTAPLIPQVIAAAQQNMVQTSTADDEVDHLIRNFDGTFYLDPRDDSTPLLSSPELPTSPPFKVHQKSAPSTPACSQLPVYRFSSPTKAGYTPDWFDAGSATQGVPGGSVRTVVKSPKASKAPASAYVVFFGRKVGVFVQWSQVQSLITGFRGAFQSGFPSHAAAEKALEYARAKGWTGDSSRFLQPLPLPSSYEPNCLNAPNLVVPPQWYVVSRGVHPGIYSSGLECHLNIAGVKSALHKSFTT
ncbi:hypothetical protein FB451DRAFT_1422840 [Mycena latifolia]|nr:hypothetical protein FB451DRAFT_1422840 [Mycena latifolia]